MNKANLVAIERHALAEYPKECCGLLIREGRKRVYVPCRNTAVTPSEHFRLAPEDYAVAEERGEVLAVIHSHPDYPPAPSEADRVACEASGLPWHILEVRKDDDGTLRKGDWASLLPTGYQAPLIGRSFAHGIHDCLSIILDYYRRELGIELGSYQREDGWWDKGGNLYLEHLPQAGFERVNDLRQGDVVLMQIRSPVTNHAGVYLGNGQMLHHLHGRLSESVPYGGMWAERTRCIVRHREVRHD